MAVRLRRRPRRAAGLLVVAFVGACLPARQPAPPQPPVAATESASPRASADRTLRWAIGEPTAIVPPDATTPDDLLVVDALFDSLTDWGDKLQVRPGAASRWWPSQRATVWTFTLRAGASFHDGSPVTAQDFVTAWTATARGAAHHHLRDVVGYRALRAGRRERLHGVRALDERTLQVRLSHPWSSFPAVVAHPALGPVPTAAWTSNQAAFREQPVGNGPFRIAEAWAHDRFVRVSRTGQDGSASHGAPAERSASEVLFQIMGGAAAYVAFQQQRVDVATLPPGALSQATEALPASRDGYHGPGLLRGEIPAVYLLAFNPRRPPFDDVRVRRAVGHALRRDRIVATSLSGNVRQGLRLVSPAVPGGRYRPCPACVTNMRRARRGFARAGVDELTLWFNGGGGHEAVVEQLRADLAAAGVDLAVREINPARYLRALRDGGPGFFRFGWNLDYPTLDNALYPLFHSRATPERGGGNFMRYADARVDRLLQRARATLDERRRVKLYRRVEDLAVGRDVAVVPVMTFRHQLVVAARVRRLLFTPMATVDLRAVRLAEPEPSTPSAAGD